MAVRRLAPTDIQPKSFAFSPENVEWAKRQIEKYPQGRQASAVIPLLWRAQEQSGGWVSQKAIEYVAGLLDMPPIRVLEVATFYTMFNLAPVGRYHVQLCGTVPCAVCGAEDLKKLCHERIGEQYHVTDDGTFSWVEVECLGACVNAPMVQINADYYEDLTPESFGRILDELAAGRTPRPGPQVQRQFSAPIGGPTTLTDPGLYPGTPRPGHPRPGTAQHAGPTLEDERAKKPGEAASFREADVPQPPAADSSGRTS
jgi:NADH-quinone oxidoreductase subunit E